MKRTHLRSLALVLVLTAVAATASACGGLVGDGAAAQPSMLMVTPTALSFGPIDLYAKDSDIAQTSLADDAIAVTVSNVGAGAIALDSVRIAAPDDAAMNANAWFSLIGAPAAGTELAAAESVTFYVRFTPDGRVNAYSGTLVIANSSSQPTVTVPVSGTVLAPPQAVVKPTALDFGNHDINGQSELGITIGNNGGSTLVIAGLGLNAGSAPQFQLDQAPQMPVTLQPNQELDIPVRFSSVAAGTFSGAVSIIGAGGSILATVPLSAMAGIGEIAVTPAANASVPMGTQVLGGAGIEATYLVSNIGKGDLAIKDLAIAGTDFAVGFSPAVLKVGDTLDAVIRFDDTTGQPAQARIGTVTIDHDGLGITNFSVTVRVVLPTLILDEGFEMNALPPDWRISGTADETHDWELGAADSYLGNAADESPAMGAPSANVVGTTIASHYAASPARLSRLDSPVLDFSKAAKPALQFSHFVSLEHGYGAHDCATLQLSLDGGLTFKPINVDLMLRGAYNTQADGGIGQAYAAGTPCWGGYIGWQTVLVDLADAAGCEQVVLRWEFSADESIAGGAGWYLDNVQVGEMVIFP